MSHLMHWRLSLLICKVGWQHPAGIMLWRFSVMAQARVRDPTPSQNLPQLPATHWHGHKELTAAYQSAGEGTTFWLFLLVTVWHWEHSTTSITPASCRIETVSPSWRAERTHLASSRCQKCKLLFLPSPQVSSLHPPSRTTGAWEHLSGNVR